MGWLSKPPPPPPAPDYTAAAEKTAASNQDAQTRADWANRPDQVTPWGTESWSSSQQIDPATGKPVTKWTQNTTLSGQQQEALDDQMAIQAGKSDLAMGMMGRVGEATRDPFSTAGMQQYGAGGQLGNMTASAGMGIQGTVGGTGLDSRMRLEDQMMARMQPGHDRAQAMLETKLQNMGLTRGSDAWNDEMKQMMERQSADRFSALQAGLGEQQGQFGMNLQAGQFGNQAQQQGFGQMMDAQGQDFSQEMAQSNYQNQLRQQQIAEQQLLRTLPLNEMNALLTGAQVQNPTMPGFNTSTSAGGTNYSGAATSQHNAAMDSYNAGQQANQSKQSGMTSLVAAGAMMF